MSRINPSSASGVRVAAQPLSNIYTVLLIIGFLGLALTLVMLWITLDQRYGVTFAVSDEGKAALAAPGVEMAKQKTKFDELEAKRKAIRDWPRGPTTPVLPAVPAVPGRRTGSTGGARRPDAGAAGRQYRRRPAPDAGAAPVAPVAP